LAVILTFDFVSGICNGCESFCGCEGVLHPHAFAKSSHHRLTVLLEFFGATSANLRCEMRHARVFALVRNDPQRAIFPSQAPSGRGRLSSQLQLTLSLARLDQPLEHVPLRRLSYPRLRAPDPILVASARSDTCSATVANRLDTRSKRTTIRLNCAESDSESTAPESGRGQRRKLLERRTALPGGGGQQSGFDSPISSSSLLRGSVGQSRHWHPLPPSPVPRPAPRRTRWIWSQFMSGRAFFADPSNSGIRLLSRVILVNRFPQSTARSHVQRILVGSTQSLLSSTRVSPVENVLLLVGTDRRF
jgi:hypothetical protein